MRSVAFVLLALQVCTAGAQPAGHGIFRGRPVMFEIQGEYGVVDGDIILGKVVELTAEARSSIIPRDSSVVTGARFRWPNGVIPYAIQADVPNPQRIHDAMTEWNTRTNIRWMARQNEPNYVTFVRGSGCSSAVGMVGGAQNLNLADTCTAGQTMHEMGHAAGLWHTQQRNDRDQYVQVLYGNLDKSPTAGNYDSRFQDADDTGPYDFASIMHYSRAADQRAPGPTMQTIPPGIPIGQRVRLTAQDIETVMRIYGQAPQGVTVTTNPEGLSITVDNVAYTAPHIFDWTLGEVHTIVAGASQSQGPNRYLFALWSDGGDVQHDITVSAGVSTYSAHFIEQYLVRTAVSPAGGGAVTVSPASPDGYYTAGTMLRITDTPAAGFNFLQWAAGAGGTIYQILNWQGRSSNPTDLAVLQNDMFYTATFTQSAVTVITSNFTGRLVSIDGTVLSMPINVAWAANSTHTLDVPSPQAGLNSTSRFVFQQWSNGGGQSQGVTASATPYMVQFKRQFAVATHVTFLIRTGVTRPSSQNLVMQPPSPDGFYDAGSTVNFTAIDGSGFQFAHWYGDLTGSDAQKSIVVNDQVDVTGEFLSPGFLSNSIVNDGASRPGPISPGTVVTIYSPAIGPASEVGTQPDDSGQFPTSVAGVTVLFDELPAMLLSASRNQVRAVAPYGIAGRRRVVIAILDSSGRTLTSRTWGVLDSSPGIYTADASGVGQAIAANADGSLNSTSAAASRGSNLTLQVTGLGLVVGDTPAPALPIAAQIGGIDAAVTSIQSGSLPGVFLVTVIVPAGGASGDSVPVSVSANSRPSPGGPTVAIAP